MNEEPSHGWEGTMPPAAPPDRIVCHYTSAEVGIFSILESGKLRLSPMNATNDPWENLPIYPPLQSRPGEEMKFLVEIAENARREIDRDIRLHSKILSLTMSWPEHSRWETPTPGPGYKHLSSWAHYGARGSGICLVLDLDALIGEFEKLQEGDAFGLHGPVEYWPEIRRPYFESIKEGYLERYGTDAVARHYAEANAKAIFLTKHSDWSSEYEYRFALMNQFLLPEYVNIREALRGVVVGNGFPAALNPALFESLESYPDPEVTRLVHQYHRYSHLDHYSPIDGDKGYSITPSLSGTLQERLAAIRAIELEQAPQAARP